MNRLSFSRLIVYFLCMAHCIQGFSIEENFFLINGMTDEIIIELGPNIHKQMSPCSTFKIPLSLIGYDAEVLKDETNPIWDFQEGYDDWHVFWKDSQSPVSWMKHSCVWYSKVLSIELGLEKIQNYVTSIGYGNQDISGGLIDPGPLNPFWINSSIMISPKEQVIFLQKMIWGQLPVSKRAVQMTRSILFKEELSEGWKLFGKTGWSGSDSTNEGKILEHGWFVGWVEKDYSFYPFAYIIRDKKIELDQRIPRVKQLLMESNVMHKRGNE